MRIVASPDVVEFVRAKGGRVFVWTVSMVYGFGFRGVFSLEASTESPGPEREFLRFGGDGIEVLYDPGAHGTPDELHLQLKGRTRKRVAAYFNGHNYASDV
jgi:hypothetical protein